MNALWWLSHLAWVGGFLLATLLLAKIIRQRRAPSSTLAWILFIVTVPYLGVPFYLFFGGRKLQRIVRSKRNLLRAEKHADTSKLPPLEQLLASQGIAPASGGNNFYLCETGEESFATLSALIDEAQECIDMCFFILHPDAVGRDILARLMARARAGVQVRLLLDGVGSMHTRPGFLQPLAEAGGDYAFFNPILRHPLQGRGNLRNHRKLAIFDGRKALAGGANIASEYMGPDERPGRWRDLTFVVEGPVVARFGELFLADWRYATGTDSSDGPLAAPMADGEARLQVVPSGPDMPGDPLYDVLLTAIFSAQRRIWLVTPYFIPDDALCRALILAVHRGVDVRILMPRQSNHRLADVAGRGYLREIQEEGGRIFLYSAGMVHAKAMLVDEDLAILGSANMDLRSLLLNYEVGVLVTSRPEVGQVAVWLNGLMQESAEGVASVGAIGELGEGLARLLAPQL